MKYTFFCCLFIVLCQCREREKPSPPSDVTTPERSNETSLPPAKPGALGEDRPAVSPPGDLRTQKPEDVKSRPIIAVCERTPQVQKAILLQLKQNECQAVDQGDLALVQELNLTNKAIVKLKSFDFEGLVGLKKLSLHHNRMEFLPPGVFSNLTSLKYLSLAHNKIKILDLQVFKDLKHLEALVLSGNELGSSSLFNETFKGLLSLQILYLNDNKIKILPASFFKGLVGLKKLYINRNKIHFLPVGLFYDTPALRILDISYNRLTSDSLHRLSFSQLPDLEQLNLEGSRISVMTSRRLKKVWGDKLKL